MERKGALNCICQMGRLGGTKKGGVCQGYTPGKEARAEVADSVGASSRTGTPTSIAFVQSSQKMWRIMMEMRSLRSHGCEYYTYNDEKPIEDVREETAGLSIIKCGSALAS